MSCSINLREPKSKVENFHRGFIKASKSRERYFHRQKRFYEGEKKKKSNYQAQNRLFSGAAVGIPQTTRLKVHSGICANVLQIMFDFVS
jgi:hypothetical protein